MHSVEIAAGRAGRAEDNLQAAAHAQAAVRLGAFVDAWSNEPVTLGLMTFGLLAACGEHPATLVALAEGVACIERDGAPWTDPAHRKAWRDGNPLHCALPDLEIGAKSANKVSRQACGCPMRSDEGRAATGASATPH